MTPHVRAATPADAEAACEVIRRSIAECCLEDHHGDSHVVAAWLADKTPDRVRTWIASNSAFGVVATSDGSVGFALLTTPGEVSLCYVVHEAHGFGVGRAMLAALEAEATRRGLDELTLGSTETAHRFYLRLGFVDTGPARRGRFITAYPMRKTLT